MSNLPVDKTYNYIANGEVTGQQRAYSENNLVSFMVRAQYNLMDKYLFNLAVRRDGSSRFGTDNKWGTFPSVALRVESVGRRLPEGCLMDEQPQAKGKLRNSRQPERDRQLRHPWCGQADAW